MFNRIKKAILVFLILNIPTLAYAQGEFIGTINSLVIHPIPQVMRGRYVFAGIFELVEHPNKVFILDVTKHMAKYGLFEENPKGGYNINSKALDKCQGWKVKLIGILIKDKRYALELLEGNELYEVASFYKLEGKGDHFDTISIPRSQKVDRKDEPVISEIEKLTNARDAEALISTFLKNKDWETKRRATEALCKIGKEAVAPLILTLRDEDKFVREHAAGALGKIKDTRAIEPLIAALKDENVEVQLKAAEALETITGKNFGTDWAKWNEWWQKNKVK